MKYFSVLLFTCLAFVVSHQANAASFSFTFDIVGEDFAGGGTFDGTLASDGDTINDMSNMMLSYTNAGVTYSNTGNPLALAEDHFWSLSGLNGSWIIQLPWPGGMAISTQFGVVDFGEPQVVSFAYDPAQFDIVQTTTPVPLPASISLTLIGLGALVAVRRRRRA